MIKFTVIICCFIILGCSSETKSTANPSLLVPGINSYLSPHQVKDLVKRAPGKWQILEDNKTPANDKRPPFHFFIIAISDFEDLGEQGKAKFCFYNNRLMSILFYPRDLQKYIQKLEKERGLRFDSNQQAFASTNTRISIGMDSTGKASYVAFDDVVLEKELDDWISRWS